MSRLFSQQAGGLALGGVNECIAIHCSQYIQPLIIYTFQLVFFS
jgi:hypothetical protein